MTLTSIQQKSHAACQWCAIALGFTIPISAALDNLVWGMFMLLWVASGDLAGKLRQLSRHSVSVAALLVTFTILLGTLWSSAEGEHVHEAWVDALRFAMVGLFTWIFSDTSTRDRAQFAFLLSSAIILVISFTLATGLVDSIPGTKGRPDYPVVFKYHITHNLFMAAAALLFTLHAIDARSRRARMLFGLLAAAAIVNVFLLIPGRTGQFALAATIIYLGIARFRWRGALFGSAALTILAAATWATPGSVMHQRFTLAWQEAAAFNSADPQPETSSVGLRLEFYRNALELMGERPILGFGSGGFHSAYESKVHNTHMVVADHPHNAFLHIGVELGLLGLAVLIGLIVVQWKSAGTIAAFNERAAARGLVVIFVAAGLFTSTFGDHAEGLFYVWASGLLFANAGWREPSKQ